MMRPTMLFALLLLSSMGAAAMTRDAQQRDPQRQVETSAPPVAQHVVGSPQEDGIVDAETVVVSGILPGPGLWKVRKGDHVLYVMATLAPLPKRMEWESAGVESVVARSGRVILPPSFTLDSDIGVFRSMMLLPSLLKARRNPDGRTLQQSVPPELYARWLPLKRRYLGNDRGVEQWRPIFAAQELYEAAMRRSGLDMDDVVGKTVAKAAKRHGVPRQAVNYKLVIADPKAAIREFQDTALADTDCFARTLERIERDLETMRQRANAWAIGDVATLRALPVESQYATCIRAVTETGLARKLGMGDLRAELARMWMAAAEAALDEEAISVAMLPLGLVLGADGYLARLEAKGYGVEPPAPPATPATPDGADIGPDAERPRD